MRLDADAFLTTLRTELRAIGWLATRGEIYICADDSTLDECACLTCILDPAKGPTYPGP